MKPLDFMEYIWTLKRRKDRTLLEPAKFNCRQRKAIQISCNGSPHKIKAKFGREQRKGAISAPIANEK